MPPELPICTGKDQPRPKKFFFATVEQPHSLRVLNLYRASSIGLMNDFMCPFYEYVFLAPEWTVGQAVNSLVS